METIFRFDPLKDEHLNMLCRWFNETHVKEWWDDKLTDAEIKSKYAKRISNTLILPFIAYLDDKPIGFIQYYYANRIERQWWPDEMEGTVGIDQLIGEEEYINRGFGTQMIGQFIAKIFTDSKIIKVITDVDENNHRQFDVMKN